MMVRFLITAVCAIFVVGAAHGQSNNLVILGDGGQPQPSGISVPTHQGQGIHCAPGGCISSGPNCDTTALPGQCTFPAGTDPMMSCFNTPGCVAVTCNEASGECYARSVTDLTPMAGFNSMVFGEMSIGGTAGSTFSDFRLKNSIERVGTTVHALPLYRFNYIGREGRYEGVMAQDVMDVMPEAVTTNKSGYYLVDYTMLGTRMRKID